MKDKRENSEQPPAGEAAASAGSTAAVQAVATQGLRKRAEELGRVVEPPALSAKTPEEIQRVLHELRVHEVELEIQNEELRRTRAELEASQARYFDLYDMAPVGYCTISEKGLILEANLTAAKLLNVARKEMVEHRFTEFILPEDQDLYYRYCQQLFKTGEPRDCELRLRRRDGSLFFWARLDGILAKSTDEATVSRIAISDITDRKQSIERIRKTLGATVQAIASVVETRDPYTAGHQRRVADVARAIATEMGLPPDRIDGIRITSTIHDIGKISVPAEILSMPRKLTELEFDLIKTHAQSGYEILKDIEFPWPTARIILEHHERMDGSGYPHGLTGTGILLESRILAVADVVESMASYRPYRPALGLDAALEEITRNKGILYDQEVVDTCLGLFKEKGYKIKD